MTVDQAKADTAVETTLKRLYRLTGMPTRLRSLTRAEAAALNGVRGDSRKWVLDPAATVEEITDEPIDVGDKNVLGRIAASVRRQGVQYLKDAHEKETAMKVHATSGARKAKRIPGLDDGAKEWRGLSMCQILRYVGHKGGTSPQGKAICERAGFVPAKGTVIIQMGKGRKGESVPNLSPELSAELLGDVLPPKGSGKAKKEKLADPTTKAERKAAKMARRAAKREKNAKLLKEVKPAA